MNYNVPEGSYASDPQDPTSRVLDMKAMIDSIHDAGMYVIMDVVYNHVFDVNRSPLHRTVPGYYFRYSDACALQNGTGVGNETASEQPMMRKYMVDSLKYWASQYQIDGFRFDLMGIHDVETMNQIRAGLDEVDSTILLLGEGWNMGNHPQGVLGANQDNAKLTPRVAYFNDNLRDTMKGTHNRPEGTGYVSGGGSEAVASDVFNLIKGAQSVRNYADASQSVNYNEAHDNLTMYDKLKGSLPNASEDEIIRRHAFATELQFLSNGVNFVHAGQEALRTKGGDENSYKSPDSVNVIDYDRAATYADSFAYFQKLAKFRAENDWVRMREYREINGAYKPLSLNEGEKRFSYKVSVAGEPDRVVFINPDNQAWKSELPEGDWNVILSDIGNTLEPAPMTASMRSAAATGSYSGSVSIPGISAVVFEKAPAPGPDPTEEPSETPSEEPTVTPSVDPSEEPTETPSEEPGTDASDPTDEVASDAEVHPSDGGVTPSGTVAPSTSKASAKSSLAKTGVQAGLLSLGALALAGAGLVLVRARTRAK